MKKGEHTYILGIESSCDETSASVCHNGKILSNIIAAQAIHTQYGGVVPELASRAHMQNIVLVVDQAMIDAGISLDQLDAIAFTSSPGLIGALLVGTGFAKSLALSLDISLIAVHHMQAHVLSNLIADPQPEFPFLCLTVSGGHTQIVLCKDALNMEILGETLDDAAGEAFDKAAKMLGFPYPGGPLIDKYAKEGDPLKFEFARPKVGEFNYSFSGLKTSILYFLQKEVKKNDAFISENLNDLCASIQFTIVKILLKKLKKAADFYKVNHIAVAGGVSANSGLRNAIIEMGVQEQWSVHIPRFEYCTDNAAMIGISGYYKFLNKQFASLDIAPFTSQ